MDVTTGGQRTRLLVTVGAYCALLVFGLVQGMIGSFQYGRMAGPVPVAAVGFCVLILATCVLAALGMRSVSGALAPALGWIVASFVLSMPVSNGSVIITDSTAGTWYLYGGTAAAVLGVLASLSISIRPAGRR
ncbi:MAG: hypothetical protein JO132_16600 [Streptosporangiaceae bacterium]|nr:hypothetical protein [Streptosporangiaceae bacterium]